MHISGVNKTYEVEPLEDSAGNIISQYGGRSQMDTSVQCLPPRILIHY